MKDLVAAPAASLLDAVAGPRHRREALVRDRRARRLAQPVLPSVELRERPLDLGEERALAHLDREVLTPLGRALRRFLELRLLVRLWSSRRGCPKYPEDPGALLLQLAAQLVELGVRQDARHRRSPPSCRPPARAAGFVFFQSLLRCARPQPLCTHPSCGCGQSRRAHLRRPSASASARSSCSIGEALRVQWRTGDGAVKSDGTAR